MDMSLHVHAVTNVSPGAVHYPTPDAPLTIAARAQSTGRRIRRSLVPPPFNEAENGGAAGRRRRACLAEPLGGAYELIVVDDDSPDRTWEVAERLVAAYPKLSVIRRTLERGLSTAVIRGWQAARGDVLAVIDADFQHPPEVIVALWDE